jgi:hypothetical protein
MSKKLHFLFTVLASVLMLALLITPATAHEHREVGDYAIVFGWRVEPAYAGQFNGPELFITHHDTEEPVEGLEETLQLEVSFGPEGMLLPVRAVFGEPGHYTADLIPTRPGDYSFHLTGSIGDVTVAETFSSADGEFSSVEPIADIMFPAPASADDIQAQIAALQAQIDELKAMLEQ